MHISEIQPGSELYCWMRLGFALEKYRTVHGVIYRVAPTKPRRANANALSIFNAYVHANNTETKVIHLTVTGINRKMVPNDADPLPAYIHYSYFSRMRYISPFSYPGHPPNAFRPTTKVKFAPYRTMVDVGLV